MKHTPLAKNLDSQFMLKLHKKRLLKNAKNFMGMIYVTGGYSIKTTQTSKQSAMYGKKEMTFPLWIGHYRIRNTR